MNFNADNAVTLILAGTAEIARIAEKNSSAITAIIWKPNFSDLSDPSDSAAIES